MASKNIKGITIEIGGNTSPLNKALEGSNKTTRDLQSELRQVEKLLKLDPTNTELLAQKQKLLAESVSSVKGKLETLKIAEAQVQEQFEKGEVSEEQYRALQREVIKTEQDLNKFEKQAKETGEESATAGKEVGTAGNSIKESGDNADVSKTKLQKFGSALKSVGTAAVAAGKVAVKAITAMAAATTAAVAGIAKMTVDSGILADELITTANITGLSTTQLQEFEYASRFVDVSVDTMSGSMVKLTKTMSNARDGSATAQEAYKKLGIEYKNADGTLRDSKQVWYETIDALGKVANETERDAIAQQIFGKSAAELNPLIKAGSASLAELGKEAQNMGIIMSEDAVKKLGAFDDQRQRISAGLEGLKNTISIGVLPIVTSFAELIEKLTGTLNTALQTGDFSSFGTILADGISTAFTKLSTMMTELTPIMAQVIGAIAAALVEAIPIMLPALIDATLQLLTTFIQILTDNGPMLIDAAINAVSTLVHGILQALPQLIDAALKMIVTLSNGIVQALPKLIPVILLTIATIVEGLIDNVDQLIDASIAAIIALAEGLINALPILIEKAPTIIAKLAAAIIRNLPKILSAGITLIVKLGEGLIQGMPKLIAKIPQIISSIVNAFTSNISKFLNIGKNIVDGIWSGINNAKDWLFGNVKSMFSGVIDGVKNFLGIHSPSTVFASIGNFMAQGLGQGFTKAMGGISNAMQAVIPTSFNADILGNYQLRSAGSLSSIANDTVATGKQTNIIYNFNSPKALDEAEEAKLARREGQRLQLLLSM